MMKIIELLFLSLVMFQIGHVDGMELPILPMDLMPDIIKYAMWLDTKDAIWRPINNNAWNSIKRSHTLQLVSKDFKHMFWNCFTLQQKDYVIRRLLGMEKWNKYLVDTAVSMRASLYPILKHSIKEDHLESVRVIVAIGDAEVINKIDDSGYYPSTPLHLAIDKTNFRLVKLLLDCPVIQVNKIAPLCRAVSNKNIKMVELLLAHPQIEVNALDENRETALFAIADYFWTGETDTLRLIIDLLIEAGIDSSIKNKQGKTAFDVVRDEARHEVFQVLEQAFAVEKNNL